MTSPSCLDRSDGPVVRVHIALEGPRAQGVLGHRVLTRPGGRPSSSVSGNSLTRTIARRSHIAARAFPAAAPADPSMTVDVPFRSMTTPAELSQQFVEALNSRDFGAFRLLLADSLEYHALVGPKLRSAEQVVEFYRNVLESLPTRRIEIDHALCDDEWAGIEIWAVDTKERTDAAQRFGVFHRWIDGHLTYYRAYAQPVG
jgi:hypothetical protein